MKTMERKLAIAVTLIFFCETWSFVPLTRHAPIALHEAKMKLSNDEFWEQQKLLVNQMSESADKSLREEQLEKFATRRNYLLGDTVYLSVLLLALLWWGANTPFTPLSYAFGTICGLLYTYGLSKYVESIGGGEEDMEGAGIGQARFAFLILMVLFLGKYRSSGLQEIPAILGFFTYQLSTLGQGLREIND